MHKTYGLMNRVITEAAQSGYKVYKWCIFDVMEKCPDGGFAMTANSGRTARAGPGMPTAFTASRTLFPKSARSPGTPGSARCLCFQPSQEGLIYKEFDMALHVV